MSTSEAPTSSHVVGHQGSRVDIAQRSAIAVNGWLGVVVLAVCVAGRVRARAHEPGCCGCRASSSSWSSPRS